MRDLPKLKDGFVTSGLVCFRDLLRRLTKQTELKDLSAQVEALSEINTTLRNYLEVVVEKISPENASEVIAKEKARLHSAEVLDRLSRNLFFQAGLEVYGIKIDAFKTALENAATYSEFVELIVGDDDGSLLESDLRGYEHSTGAMKDLNEARSIVDRPPLVHVNERLIPDKPRVIRRSRPRDHGEES